MNQTAVVMMAGHVVTEPKLAHTKSGQPFARVRIGVTTRRPDRHTGEWQDIASSYFTVNCWRRMAMNASASLRKGDPVIVWGKLRSRTWMDADGQRHRIIDIEADTICHDASMGWTLFNRGATPGAGADEGARRDLAAAEDVDVLGDSVMPDDLVDHALARDGLVPDGFTPGIAAPGVDDSHVADGSPLQDGGPGGDEVPAAAAGTVAMLVTEAAPF
jgi:single-strand DNA-binding protein